MKIVLPEAVREIIDTLEEASYEAYAVGGCVRDSLISVSPKDWDITTSALPEQVKELFPITIDTGIQHGTVTVMKQGEGYEVTTYRIDGDYEDGRHPKEVTFTRSLREDLKRRDFTINAMAYSEAKGLVDLFEGEKDLERRIVRCVGVAEERFTEDALRMLRAVRFSAQLHCDIEEETLRAMEKLSPNLKKVSAERIYTEFYKTLITDSPECLEAAVSTGLLDVFLPELTEALSEASARESIFSTLKGSDKDLYVREAVLFSVLPGEDLEASETARAILHRLKTDRKAWNEVSHLLKWRGKMPELTDEGVRRFLSKEGRDFLLPFIAFKRAIRPELAEELTRLEKLAEEINRRGDCIVIKELALNGKDLIAMGVSEGQLLGETLNALLDYVLSNPEANKKELLMDRVKDMLNDR